MNVNECLNAMHRDLGLKRLSSIWAKVEILLGLTVATSAFLYGVWIVVHFNEFSSWPSVVGCVVLQVLGLYLAMAGHRSHIYQSQNKLTAYVTSLLSTKRD